MRVVGGWPGAYRALVAERVEDDQLRALRAEIKRLREELAESHRGASVLDAELEAHARELERVDKHRNEFLAMLAHELRNPLAAIEMVSETLDATQPGDDISGARQVLRRQLDNLRRMVDDLLDVSRVIRGKITVEMSQAELRQVVQAAVTSKVDAADAAGVDLLLQLPDQPVHVRGDPTRLEQIVVNLVDNAVTHTPRGGRVTVSLLAGPSEDGGGSGAHIRVADTGRGMTEEELDDVFTLFVQHRPDPHVTQGGLGLGLTLAHRLASLHDGTLRASSPGIGLGAVFEVELPLARASESPPSASARTVQPRTGVDDAMDPGRRNPLAGRVIVLVDDNEDFRELLARGLGRAGAEVIEAASAQQALTSIEARLDDVSAVVADLGLPGMTGDELAQAVRGHERAGALPLVAVTGYGGKRERKRTRAAGFDAHLVKPVRVDELVDALVDVWSRRAETADGPESAAGPADP